MYAHRFQNTQNQTKYQPISLYSEEAKIVRKNLKNTHAAKEKGRETDRDKDREIKTEVTERVSQRDRDRDRER